MFQKERSENKIYNYAWQLFQQRSISFEYNQKKKKKEKNIFFCYCVMIGLGNERVTKNNLFYLRKIEFNIYLNIFFIFFDL